MQPLPTTTSYWLIAISIAIAIVASYAAFSFAERIRTAQGMRAYFWLSGGALSMGLGVWSMHFLAMLSIRLPIEVVYHVPGALLSLVLAVLSSAIALALVSRPGLSQQQVAVGGFLMGGGIAGMHYTGMHAMRLNAMHRYDPSLVALSIAVAVILSWVALWITFAMRSDRRQREWIRIGGAAIMGVSISGMHLTAQAAVSFIPDNMPFSTVNTVRVSTLGIFSVVCTTSLVLIGALVTAILDRRMYQSLEEINRRLMETRSQLRKSQQALLEANARLLELSIRDGLTGVFNRRYFDETLKAEWRRAQRSRHRLTLALIDIDHFKALNDHYGHAAGDECLRMVAQALVATVRRPGDVVARYGGEEFAVILPGADAEGALRLADAMRSAVDHLKVRIADLPESPHITISVGVATIAPDAAVSASSIVDAADRALYRAKDEGRNAVRVA